MKAKELMCDDIVLHHGNAYKVFGIMGEANGVDLFPVQLRNAEGLILAPLTCFATEIAPIPLTAEILEKNGYEKHIDSTIAYTMDRYIGDVHIWVQFYKEKPHLGLQKFGAGTFELHCFLNHTHELQHALRLCGLNDLADNFKV